MSWTLELATRWSERLLALSVFLQAIELLLARRAWVDDGVWSWPILKREHEVLPSPLRWLFSLVLPERPFLGLVLLEAAAALAFGLGVGAVAPFLLFAEVAVCVRFRGTFNGGSDTLTVLTTLSFAFAWLLGGAEHPLVGKACLGYIAVQLTLSYFIAGLAKLKEADWRSGAALRGFVRSRQYGAPPFVRRLLDGERRCQLLSWCVLLFECGFPLAWLDPRLCTALIALGLAFHLGNWLVFGLNRFVFAWAAAYPALLFGSQLVASAR
ncbi:MAG TPA: HTTM domain-containing protein [Polyangiaceae bacterium]|nr:HTTM domain-containing protein [Polyangiaceae bacterium]